MDSQFLIIISAGLGIALSSACLGTFVISQRLSYFSDALAHAALLGISLSLILALPVNISFVLTALVFAALFSWLLGRATLSSDTLIGILAHSFLAFSLLSLSLFSDRHIDLEHYLLGDLVRVNGSQLPWIGLCLLLNIVFIARHWQALVLMTIHRELALVEGINVPRLRLQMTLLLAFLVAVSIQLIGALLISALLIIPTASARQWANSPLKLMLSSAVLACIAMLGGIALSASFATPAGPSVVAIASLMFCLALGINLWRERSTQ